MIMLEITSNTAIIIKRCERFNGLTSYKDRKRVKDDK